MAVIARYISPMNAEAILERVISALYTVVRPLSWEDVPSVVAMLRGHSLVFLSAGGRERLFADLDVLATTATTATTRQVVRLVVRSPKDIVLARSLARKLCEQLGASGFAAQKTTTVVSELARNISAYAGTGTIEMTPLCERRRLLVRAVDSGPGISNLEDILAGRYRSRTGLGQGLCGVKRLAERFQVDTNPSGTSVEAEVAI